MAATGATCVWIWQPWRGNWARCWSRPASGLGAAEWLPGRLGGSLGRWGQGQVLVKLALGKGRWANRLGWSADQKGMSSSPSGKSGTRGEAFQVGVSAAAGAGAGAAAGAAA